MPCHPDRVRRNCCEHIWEVQPWAYNFLVCKICGGWTQDKINVIYPKKGDVKFKLGPIEEVEGY